MIYLTTPSKTFLPNACLCMYVCINEFRFKGNNTTFSGSLGYFYLFRGHTQAWKICHIESQQLCHRNASIESAQLSMDCSRLRISFVLFIADNDPFQNEIEKFDVNPGGENSISGGGERYKFKRFAATRPVNEAYPPLSKRDGST